MKYQITTLCVIAMLYCVKAGYLHTADSYAHFDQYHHIPISSYGSGSDGGGGGGGGDGDDGGHQYEDYHSGPINYKYGYAVHDPHTGDNKEAWEHRDGDSVKGSYSLTEPDGTKRIVDYTADKHLGFIATVKKIGHGHSQIEHYPSHY